MLAQRDPGFDEALRSATGAVIGFSQTLALNTLRKKARKAGLAPEGERKIRLGIVGGPSLRPLADLIEHFVASMCRAEVELWIGDFDNYLSEILDETSALYAFAPDAVFVLPADVRCRPRGSWTSPYEALEAEANDHADELKALADAVHARSGAEVVLANFRLPGTFDPGPIRGSSLASEYGFKKAVNARLGRLAGGSLHLCDVEFVANRMGTLAASDERAWFESKQPGSPELMVLVAREVAAVVGALHTAPKKVAILDLDNTLWGGVIGDDGLEGIELGTTSPRGEAFRAFQSYLKSLTQRGVLLAVCSKNGHDKAVEPFEKHPEMVLRLDDIACFKANWEPKSENIRLIAQELNLGLDSFVFLDDNPAEIEIVRQFVPEVIGIDLGDDPSSFVRTVQDARLFEVAAITQEDVRRASQYKQETARRELQGTATDMGAYLASLEMAADVQRFAAVDVPRISQLTNKSNQFNLTTVRRTEAEIHELIADPTKVGFTVRLSDRFGDHGLIAIVVGSIEGETFRIDTWLMSCRVLKRQVEDLALNEIFRLAADAGCSAVLGIYRPTTKNEMVREHYPRFGFRLLEESPEESRYLFDAGDYEVRETRIAIAGRP